MKLLRDALPDIIASLIVAAILATLGVLSGALGLDRNEEVVNKALLVVWYAIIVAGTAYVFRARRKSQIHPTTSFARFGKRPKILSIIVVLVATFFIVWSFLPFTMPELQIRATNTGNNNIALANRAEFQLMLDVPMAEDILLTTGRIKLSTITDTLETQSAIVIPPGQEVILFGSIVNAAKYRRFVAMEDTYAFVYLRDPDYRLVGWSNQGIGFKKEDFTEYYLPINVVQ